MWDILKTASAAQLIGKKGKDNTLPQDQRDVLEQYVQTVTAVLRAIGASPDTLDQVVQPPAKKKHNATVLDLIKAKRLAVVARRVHLFDFPANWTFLPAD